MIGNNAIPEIIKDIKHKSNLPDDIDIGSLKYLLLFEGLCSISIYQFKTIIEEKK